MDETKGGLAGDFILIDMSQWEKGNKTKQKKKQKERKDKQ